MDFIKIQTVNYVFDVYSNAKKMTCIPLWETFACTQFWTLGIKIIPLQI